MIETMAKPPIDHVTESVSYLGRDSNEDFGISTSTAVDDRQEGVHKGVDDECT